MILLVNPVSSVDCERSFSVMNNGVLTELRNRLTDEHMRILMLIKLEGPTLTDSVRDFKKFVEIWASQRDRRGLLSSDK